MRLVVDTNLMIRALRTPGPAREFFRSAPLSHTIVHHAEQAVEVREVAARTRLGIDAEAIEELLRRIEHYGERIDGPLGSTGDCRDANDEYVLALALA